MLVHEEKRAIVQDLQEALNALKTAEEFLLAAQERIGNITDPYYRRMVNDVSMAAQEVERLMEGENLDELHALHN